MNDDCVPRQLKERTGKHFCVRCLKEVPSDQYFGNDHVCDECLEKEQPAEEPKKDE